MREAAEPVFKPEASQTGQDWHRLADYLAGRGHRLDRGQPVRQFAGGLGNLNYLIHLDGRMAVLRRPPPGPLPRGANDMMREARILTGLAPHFPLAPTCLLSCDDTAVLGAPFLVMEYRPGLVVRSRLPARFRSMADTGARIATILVDVLSRLHAVDPAAAGLADLGRPQGFVERTAAGWAHRAEQAWDGTAPSQVPEILHWLERQPAPDPVVALLHNDYKLDNLILDPDTLQPRALVDWDLGTRGDPRWDLAVLLSYWTQPDDPPTMVALRQMPPAAAGFPNRSDMVQRYTEAVDRPIDGMRPYRVLAQFRLAVVYRQIFRRFRDGDEVNPQADSFAQLADELMQFTMDVMAGRAD